MDLKIKINLNNDAFSESSRPYEIERILKEIIKKIHNNIEIGKIRDYNGNSIGSFIIE